jgi:serine/threonine-protein kinase
MSEGITRVMLSTRLEPGTHLNDTYEIDERIASGGMGEVYRGHNIQTGEPVAIKTILPELADQEAIFALFKKEATVLNRLYHDTIVRYYSFSRDPRLGRTYLAMEFVDGVSLAERIRTAPLTAAEVRKLFASVADGLALAHDAGVVHRDLSPDNIILRTGNVGRPKIIDFGIARAANIGEGTLIGGGFAGKYNFVSPEQLGIHNREVDSRSDIYSLGLVIAASLRGEPLDMGGSHVDVIEKRTRVPDLSGIDESLRPLIEAMLQPNPDERPASMSVVADWLKASAPADPQQMATGGSIPGGPGSAPASWGTQPGIQSTPPGIQPTSPGIHPATPGIRTGTPFAATADPTQVVASTSAPIPTGNPGGSESPFGNSAAYPALPSTGLPGTPLPDATSSVATTERKSGGRRYAVAGGVLMLLIAGGAYAYVSGLIGQDLGKVAGPQQSAETNTGNQPPEATPTPPVSNPTGTSQPTAKSPEHQAIGDALEDAAKSHVVAKTEEPNSNPASEPTAPTATTKLPNTVVPQDTTSQREPTTDTALAKPTDLPNASNRPASDTSTPNIPTVPPVTIPKAGTPSEHPTEADKQTQVATGALARMNAGVSWLRQYDGGRCFFVAVTSVSDRTINVKGFGLNVPAFQTLYNSFIDTNGIEPELNGHLINEAQCAATDFLKAVEPGAKNSPEIQLASDQLKLGETLKATVSNVGNRKLDLLLVDGDGLVYNMKSFAEQTADGDRAIFDMRVADKVLEGMMPEMVIAITSPSGLSVPEGKEHVRAAALFPRLTRQVENIGGDVGVDFAYFQLSP